MSSGHSYAYSGLFVCLSICLMVGTVHTENDNKKNPNLCFPVVGDIGGIPTQPFQTYSQKKVANLLAQVVKEHNCQFIVGLGDNFYYSGVKNVEDPRFYKTYERTYSAPSLVIPWYMIAGNHDHIANVSAQIAYTKVSKRWEFPDFYYTKVFPIPNTNKSLQLVMLDTTMLCWHKKNSNAPTPDKQLAWIEDTLKNSKSDYLVVAGHHPMYSSGAHGNTGCLIQKLKPLLEKYSVTAYFSGHDHNIQHIKEAESSVHYFVSGSGNFVDRRFYNKIHLPHQSSRFEYATDCGFDLVSVNKDELKIQTFTVEPEKLLQPIYDAIIEPRNMLISAPSDDIFNYMKINHEVNKIVDQAMSDIHQQSRNLLDRKDARTDINELNNLKLLNKNKDVNINRIDKIDVKTATNTETKNKDESTSPSAKEEKSQITEETKPVKQIDQSKITIDNLSDIPLSSYSDFLAGESTPKLKKEYFNKTGNKLKDFILQRLPSERIQNKEQKRHSSHLSKNETTIDNKNRTLDSNAADNQRNLFNTPTNYPGIFDYGQITNTYYGYTPSFYNSPPRTFMNFNNLNSYYNSYWQSSGGFLVTPYKQSSTPLVEKSSGGRKSKRSTLSLSEEQKSMLSNFFEIQDTSDGNDSRP